MKASTLNKSNSIKAVKIENRLSAKKIKGELDKICLEKTHIFHHFFRYDFEDKYYYIYDNDCYLFVFDKKIEVRSDRENVLSANKTFTHRIKEVEDIQIAYEHFCSMTMEDDEEY